MILQEIQTKKVLYDSTLEEYVLNRFCIKQAGINIDDSAFFSQLWQGFAWAAVLGVEAGGVGLGLFLHCSSPCLSLSPCSCRLAAVTPAAKQGLIRLFGVDGRQMWNQDVLFCR